MRIEEKQYSQNFTSHSWREREISTLHLVTAAQADLVGFGMTSCRKPAASVVATLARAFPDTIFLHTPSTWRIGNPLKFWK